MPPPTARRSAAEQQRLEATDAVPHRFARMGTIDLRVDFLRQGLGQYVLATAEATRLGGRVGERRREAARAVDRRPTRPGLHDQF